VVTGAATLGLEIPHGFQQFRIVLLAPHQDRAKPSRRCSHSHRRSQGAQRSHTPQFLENIVILCFERRFSKQNSVTRLKSNILAPQIFCPPKCLGWLRRWSHHLELGQPLGHFPVGVTSRTCLANISWDILDTHRINVVEISRFGGDMTSVSSQKFLHRANVCFVAHEAHAIAQPCRHANS